jgi:transcriptional regulator with XRE-family HTH domain
MKDQTALERVAYWIRWYRKSNGMTQAELAKKIYSARITVTSWEKGHRSISIDTLEAISKVFNVRITAFFKKIPSEQIWKH